MVSNHELAEPPILHIFAGAGFFEQNPYKLRAARDRRRWCLNGASFSSPVASRTCRTRTVRLWQCGRAPGVPPGRGLFVLFPPPPDVGACRGKTRREGAEMRTAHLQGFIWPSGSRRWQRESAGKVPRWCSERAIKNGGIWEEKGELKFD